MKDCKFIIGDKVRVKTFEQITPTLTGNLSSDNIYFNDESNGMMMYCGGVFIVTGNDVDYSNACVLGHVTPKERPDDWMDVEGWIWSEEWLEPAFTPVVLEDNLFED
jgi:hypothetical protein